MFHRTTLLAVPVIGLLMVGTGVGWWSYFDQSKQRQAMAVQAENLYSNAFHGLVSDMHDMDTELGKSVITSDVGTFEDRLRNIWRLSYAAQSEAAKLPFSLMPMHHTQQFLSNLGDKVDVWMSQTPNPLDPKVHKQLQAFYEDSRKLSSELTDLQTKVMTNNLTWVAAAQATNLSKTDNQIVDNFRKMDTAASAFAESEEGPNSMQRGKSQALQIEPVVSAQTAIRKFSEFSGLTPSGLRVHGTNRGAYMKDYIIDGTSKNGESVYAVVSQNGGHVLQYSLRHSPKNGNYDFVQARQQGQKWLQDGGFGTVIPTVSNQYDHIAYFVFAPETNSVPNISRGIMVKVALDNGQIVAYDGSNYFYYPVNNLPERRFSVSQLQVKLNPSFRVGMSQPVIALDDRTQYQPAVAFYGTSNRETYCVYMNANTGKEMQIEQLTLH